jgi:hypothetical protein
MYFFIAAVNFLKHMQPRKWTKMEQIGTAVLNVLPQKFKCQHSAITAKRDEMESNAISCTI